MKHLKSQKGYALLIVLLIVVLFLSISATFLAGSLNNAKQEQTIDTSNQSVASAEMGVRYFSTDFQRELGNIKVYISNKTQEQLLNLFNCFKSGNASCDEQHELTLKEQAIDKDMKAQYVEEILLKVNGLSGVAGNEIVPFPDDQIKYSITSAKAIKLNKDKKDSADPAVSDKEIRHIKVELIMSGISKDVTKELKASFTIEVPVTFLDESDPLTIETTTTTNTGVTYKDIFSPVVPTRTCEELLANPSINPKECKLGSGETLQGIINKLIATGKDPKDYKVFTDNFLSNVCTNTSTGNNGNQDKCNGIDFKGISVVVNQGDVGVTNNMNNLINANLIINGTLSSGNNLINLGKSGNKQTIILKELNVDNNIQNMSQTNFIILGKELPTSGSIANSNLLWGEKNHFEVDSLSRLCIDIDRIIPEHLTRVKEEVKFTNGGILVYYSASGQTFKMTGNNAVERNKSVYSASDYTTFLSACGVTLTHTVSDITEVSVPVILDPGFELDVEY